MARQKQPPKATVKLDEGELMEIMVDLVEVQKTEQCSPERAERIQKLLDEKIDPAMKKVRVEHTIEVPPK
jgi:hypothetical protein